MYKLTYYNKIWAIDNENYILFNSISNAVLKLTKYVYNAIKDGRWNEIDEETLSCLLDGYVLIQQDLDGTDIYYYEMLNIKARKDKIGIFIVPSRTCNLSCTYCMQNNLFDNKQDVYITKEIIDRYFDWIQDGLNRWGSRKIDIIFYGGEPLTTSEEMLIYLIKKFNELSVKPVYGMITNGVNLMKYTEVLKYMNSIQITIDGNKEVHDSRRIFKDGRGSYDIIINNIKEYLSFSKDKTITLRMNVDKNNRGNLLEDIESIASELPMDQITVSLNPVDPYEKGINDKIIHGDIRETALAIVRVSRYLKEKYNIEPKIWRLNCGVSSMCQWSFDTEGSIYKCPALTGEPHRAVTNIYQSHMNSSFYNIMNRKVGNNECLKCTYLGYCYGGCPRQNELTDDISCKKAFFNEYIPQMIEIKYNVHNIFRQNDYQLLELSGN